MTSSLATATAISLATETSRPFTVRRAAKIGPYRRRTYLGGPSLARAAFTVSREMPSTRAISEIAMPSARRSRRTSAQSSTPNTRFLTGSVQARVSRKLVNFQLPCPGQYSPVVNTSVDDGARNVTA
jgi:hypothetical protein